MKIGEMPDGAIYRRNYRNNYDENYYKISGTISIPIKGTTPSDNRGDPMPFNAEEEAELVALPEH